MRFLLNKLITSAKPTMVCIQNRPFYFLIQPINDMLVWCSVNEIHCKSVRYISNVLSVRFYEIQDVRDTVLICIESIKKKYSDKIKHYSRYYCIIKSIMCVWDRIAWNWNDLSYLRKEVSISRTWLDKYFIL